MPLCETHYDSSTEHGVETVFYNTLRRVATSTSPATTAPGLIL